MDTIIASLEQNNNNNATRYSVCARPSVLEYKAGCVAFRPGQGWTSSSLCSRQHSRQVLLQSLLGRIVLLQHFCVIFYFLFFFIKSIANNLNTSSCRLVGCSDKEHDGPGCNAATLSQNQYTAQTQRDTQRGNGAREAHSNRPCARSATAAFANKYLSVLEMTKDPNRGRRKNGFHGVQPLSEDKKKERKKKQ